MRIAAGAVFGQLTVLDQSRSTPRGRVLLCRCACGTEKWCRADKLPKRKSCGCKNLAGQTSAQPKHKRSKRLLVTPDLKLTHSSYCSMKARCRPNSTRHAKYYFEKGVTVCERWEKSFAAFIEDVGQRPTKAHSLDRFPNADGNYEPGNVRWATQHEQQRNRRNARRFEFEGESLSAPEIGERVGISRYAARKLLLKGKPLRAAS